MITNTTEIITVPISSASIFVVMSVNTIVPISISWGNFAMMVVIIYCKIWTPTNNSIYLRHNAILIKIRWRRFRMILIIIVIIIFVGNLAVYLLWFQYRWWVTHFPYIQSLNLVIIIITTTFPLLILLLSSFILTYIILRSFNWFSFFS